MFDAPQKPGLPPEEVVRRIQKALAIEGTHVWEDLRKQVADGKARLFYNDHGCWIVEVINSPQKRWLNAWIIAGELPEVLDLHDEIEKYAEEQGCAFMKMECRVGWKSILPKHGWKQIGIVMTREICHG